MNIITIRSTKTKNTNCVNQYKTQKRESFKQFAREMIKKYLFNTMRVVRTFSNRKMIEPEVFTTEKVDDYVLVKSQTYQFLINKLPQIHQIYRHEIQTPASVLKKPGIHILPKQMPQINKREKFKAVSKKIEQQFQKSFRNCKQPHQFFHMNRKVNTEVKKKLSFIGVVEQKYKHYMLFEPYLEKIKHKTREEYMKKGVKVECLGGVTIYPKGQVWMPTNEKYLIDFCEAIKRMESDKSIQNILDIGCGSGVLSFLSKKSFKKAKIVGFDSNKFAVDTTNVNAAQYHFDDVTAYQFDVTKTAQFKSKLQEEKLPEFYDLILLNPPWLHASRLPLQSQLEGGVYDEKGKMLESSLKIASQRLKDKNSKILLIFSDLNKNLNLEKKSVEQMCQENTLLIHNIKERPLTYNLEKPSPLNQFKQKSKIQLFEIRKA